MTKLDAPLRSYRGINYVVSVILISVPEGGGSVFLRDFRTKDSCATKITDHLAQDPNTDWLVLSLDADLLGVKSPAAFPFCFSLL